MDNHNRLLVKWAEKYNVELHDNYQQLQNPGEKSVKGLMSKVKRQPVYRTQVDLLDFKDLARCAILFDNYSQISEYLLKLRKIFPNISGDVSKNDTGYAGIHINLNIDGINAEIQLHSSKTWPYKMVGEEFYSKWRDGVPSEQKQAYTQELDLSRGAWGECFDDSDFKDFENEIEALLIAFEIENPKAEKPDKSGFSDIRHIVQREENGEFNEVEIAKCAQEVQSVSAKAQEKLIEGVSQAERTSVAQDDIQKYIKCTKLATIILNSYMGGFTKACKEFGLNNEQIQQLAEDKIKKLAAQRHSIAVNAVKFAVATDMLDADPHEVVDCMYQAMRQETDRDFSDMYIDKLVEKLINSSNLDIANQSGRG